MLTAAEYHMGESLPIYRLQEVIFEFCRGRMDVVVFDAQAVNLYVGEPRMTQGVDLLCTAPDVVAAALASRLDEQFHIAVRVRELRPGKAYRVFQIRSEGNRHLADLRLAEFPLTDLVERDGIRYVGLPMLVALKIVTMVKRRLAPPKGPQTWRICGVSSAVTSNRQEYGKLSSRQRRYPFFSIGQRLGASRTRSTIAFASRKSLWAVPGGATRSWYVTASTSSSIASSRKNGSDATESFLDSLLKLFDRMKDSLTSLDLLPTSSPPDP